jgi:lysine/ornithine N-monooxygenase
MNTNKSLILIASLSMVQTLYSFRFIDQLVSSKCHGPLPRYSLEWEENTNAETKSRVFDAVCIANGHYAMPNIPYLKGIESYQGRTMHSIEYDSPECFASETVLCVGGRASGSDLAKEISRYASHVYLSDSKVQAAETQGNVTFVPRSISINAEGCIAFANDCRITPRVDTIIFCTGYDYHFPFINDNSNFELSVKPGERRVMPLYRAIMAHRSPKI